jgi:hypothetical protein
MPNYEIRLRKRHGGTCAYRANRMSDFAAVRTAQTIAADGDAIEVWKGMDCVYASEGGPNLFSRGSSAGIFIPTRLNA